ncbi:Protein of unknown function DUF502 [Cynara cardunculus var. scolymus]|uniref:Uncharacterized protein n=1 Tax=Cynara cardunculus var. scolymus TaxID=59895 RepID=A0A103XXF4_CYNCS|nr:Protein of unknown function DUF502 [Cynara cardunculus var. scolymus]
MAEGSKEPTTSSVSQHDIIVEDTEDSVKSPPNSPNSSTRKLVEFEYSGAKDWFGFSEIVNYRFMKAKYLEIKGINKKCLIFSNWNVDGNSKGEEKRKRNKKKTLLLYHHWDVVLFPVAVTFFITWWIVQFFDGFFSPIYERLGVEIFGLGFLTSLIFIFFVGIFASSWMGATVFWVGEWFIKRMPFVKHIYSASKQISAAISPDQNTTAFKEVAIIRHPRLGEYAFGFITSSVVLQRENGDEELCSVYVPTNHLYIGDVFLVNSEEIIRPNLSIREGIGF